jgi:uncharacterized protein (UPF0248 family)
VRELRDEVKELKKENKELRASYLRVVKVGEDALSQHTQREIMVKDAAKKQELMYQLFGKITGNLHLIFQYFAGRGDATINLGENQQMEAIRGLYNSLNGEAKQMLQKFMFDFSMALDPAQKSIVNRVAEELVKANVRDQTKEIDNIGTSMPSMRTLTS